MSSGYFLALGTDSDDTGYDVIYCHNSPPGGGKTGTAEWLNEFYGSIDLASDLIDLGDLSYVDESIAAPPGETHSFQKPYPGVSLAYHRDRGEPRSRTKAHHFDTLDDLLRHVGGRPLWVYEIDRENGHDGWAWNNLNRY